MHRSGAARPDADTRDDWGLDSVRNAQTTKLDSDYVAVQNFRCY